MMCRTVQWAMPVQTTCSTIGGGFTIALSVLLVCLFPVSVFFLMCLYDVWFTLSYGHLYDVFLLLVLFGQGIPHGSFPCPCRASF